MSTQLKPAARKGTPSRPQPQTTPTPDTFLPAKSYGTLPAPDDLTPEQLNAFEGMNDPLRKKALAMRDLMSAEVQQLLESEYQLGSLVKEIYDDPGTYGATSDMKLAQFFGEYGKTKYANARRIRERYEPERFRELMDARGPDGHRLEYTHLALLLRVDDIQADALVDHVLAGSWSASQLAGYLRNKEGGKPRPGLPRPRTFLGLVENVSAVAGEFHKKYEEVWEEGRVLSSTFDEMPEEAITAESVKRVGEALEAVDDAATALKDVVAELLRIKDRMEATLSNRRAGRMAPAIPDEDGERADEEPSWPEDEKLIGDDEEVPSAL